MLGITGLLLRSGVFVSVTNTKYSEQVPVGGLHISIGLNESLPLLDHATELIRSQIHSMKVGQHVMALNVLWNQLEFPERPLSVIVALQIGQRNFKDTSLQSLRSDSYQRMKESLGQLISSVDFLCPTYNIKRQILNVILVPYLFLEFDSLTFFQLVAPWRSMEPSHRTSPYAWRGQC
jgi:hypothetical protein